MTLRQSSGGISNIRIKSIEKYIGNAILMAEWEGVTEQLKAADQMAWGGRMNNIRNRATEIVNGEIIFV